MDITPKLSESAQRISRYGDKKFTINEQEYDGSVVVLPSYTQPWPVEDAQALSVASLEPILSQSETVEILLIGSGEAQVFPSKEVRIACREKGIALEVMDTGAACRTFNILLAEARQVAAALVAV